MSNKRYREGLLDHADDARQSRELARIRTDVPVTFDPDAVQYRGATREKCFELFSRLGFRSLVMEFAPTADTVGKQYSVVATTDGAGRAGRERCGRRADSRFRVLPDGPTAMRAGIAGLVVLDRRRARRDYVPVATARPSGGGLFGDAATTRTARPAI